MRAAPAWLALGLLVAGQASPGLPSALPSSPRDPTTPPPPSPSPAPSSPPPCSPILLKRTPPPQPNTREWEALAVQAARTLSGMLERGEADASSAAALARAALSAAPAPLEPAALALGAPHLSLGLLYLAFPPRLIVFQQNSTSSLQYYWRALASSWNGSASVWAATWLSCGPAGGGAGDSGAAGDAGWWSGVSASRGSGPLRAAAAIFMRPLQLYCEEALYPWVGREPNCDPASTECEVVVSSREYHCRCREYWYLAPEEGAAVAGGRVQCAPCSQAAAATCLAPGARAALLATNLAGMLLAGLLAYVIFRKRKCKAVAIGMWTVLEVIVFGVFLIYASAAAQFVGSAQARCLAGAWLRELGFVATYGSMVLRLWVLLAEFRTRKAHRWTPKDSEVLRVVAAMLAGCVCYLGAFTATAACGDGAGAGCARAAWHHVTAAAEALLLLAGLRIAFVARNAKPPFYERNWVAAALALEALCGAGWRGAALGRERAAPELSPVAATARAHLSATVALACVLAPKLWYSLHATRHLAQEISRRGPADGFCIEGEEGTEPTSEEVRAELKRLYIQLEILRNKTLRRDNPHISKRRGGRKTPHRRFSLQALQARRGAKKTNAEASEHGDASRTPEDSVCSAEGPSHYTDGDTQA